MSDLAGPDLGDGTPVTAVEAARQLAEPRWRRLTANTSTVPMAMTVCWRFMMESWNGRLTRPAWAYDRAPTDHSDEAPRPRGAGCSTRQYATIDNVRSTRI